MVLSVLGSLPHPMVLSVLGSFFGKKRKNKKRELPNTDTNPLTPASS
jgi:hypothetical protein